MSRLLRTYRDAFAGLPSQVWWLALTVFVNRAGTMVLPFLALFLTRERGLEITDVGTYLALYGVGSIAGISIGGRLTDRVGPKPVMVVSLAGTACVLALLGQLSSPRAIGATLVLLALIGEAFRPANAAAIAAAVPPALQRRAFGLHRLAINLGYTFGPAVGGQLAEIDYQWLFGVDAATCLAATCVLAACVRASPPPTHAERAEAARDGRSPWRDRVFLAALGLLSLQALVFFQLQTTFVLFLSEVRGFGEGLVGRLLAINTIVIVLFEMILLRRIERFQALRVVGYSGIFIGLGYGLLPFGASVAWVAFAIVLWTIGEMISAPLLSAFVAERSDASNRGRYMGLFGMTFSIASMVAPILGTRVYATYGPTALWLGCLGLGCLSCAGFLVLRPGR